MSTGVTQSTGVTAVSPTTASITSGTIDGAAIGSTTPSTGNFTQTTETNDTQGSQIVTVATTILDGAPRLTIQNSASALTQTLPTSPTANRTFDLFNHGAGTMNIAGTFLGALSSPRALSQGAGITVKWNATLAGWSCH